MYTLNAARGCRFFTFVLLLFLLHSMGISLFRLTGSICRDETIASTGGVRHCQALRCKHAILEGWDAALVCSGLSFSSCFYLITRCINLWLGLSQNLSVPSPATSRLNQSPCCAGLLVPCHAAAGRLSAVCRCACIPIFHTVYRFTLLRCLCCCLAFSLAPVFAVNDLCQGFFLCQCFALHCIPH